MDPITASILLNIVIGLLASLASSLISSLITGTQEKKVRGFRGEIQTGGKVPVSIVVGTIGVAGKLEYRNTYGEVDGTPNSYLVDVISLGDVPINNVTGFFVNSQPVTKTSSGHTDRGYPIAEYNADSTDHLWWEFKDGSQTVANSFLTTTFGADGDRPWLSDMIGRGIPYVTMTALVNDHLWTGFPSYMVVCQGMKLYDPRLDTTAGGSGSQRWNDQSTWAFSDNNIVIVYNILRGIYFGAAKVWGGDVRAYQLPYANWAAAMNACDENVSLAGGGTEKRFRAGREILVEERPNDVIKEFLSGANARIAPSAGKFYVLVGVPGSAVGSFTDADVIVTEQTTLESFPNIDDIVNGATATYIEPSQAWEVKETAPYYRSDLEAEDDDRRQVVGLDLKTTFSNTQAQRIIKAAVEESRRFARHVVPLSPGFGIYNLLDVLAWTSTANGYSAKLFLITARTEAPDGNVVLGLQEVDPTDHDWVAGTDEQSISFAPMTPIKPPPQPMTGWAVVPYTYRDPSGAPRRPGIEISYAGGLVDVIGVHVQIRLSGETLPFFDSDEFPYDPTVLAPSNTIVGDFLLPNTLYEVRGKFVPLSSRLTDWSSWLSVTTPDIRLGFTDLDAALIQWNEWIGLSLRDLTEQAQLTSALSADQDAANYADRIYVIEQMALQNAASQALFVRTVLLALGLDGSALADAIEAIEAASGDIRAGVYTRMTAFASPGGGWARYGIQVRASFADTWPASASIFLEATSAGDSRIALVANDTYVVDLLGNVLAAFSSDGGVAYARIPVLYSDKLTVGIIDTSTFMIDGVIVNSKILDGEISNTVSSTQGSPVTLSPSATSSSLVSASMTGRGGTTTVSVSGTVSTNGPDSNRYGVATAELYRSGVKVAERTGFVDDNPLDFSPSFDYVDTSPGTSAIVYSVKVKRSAGTGWWGVGWFSEGSGSLYAEDFTIVVRNDSKG